MKPLWVIQSNLNRADVDRVVVACEALELPHQLVEVIPCSDELPEGVPTNCPTVFYGATHFINEVQRAGRWLPGVYFNERLFRVSTWMQHYGSRMLNEGAELSKIGEFGKRDLPADKLFFIRPDRDLKEFCGEVVPFGEFREWYQRISAGEYLVGPDCRIIVAEPVGIAAEWRLFIVNGKVSSGSQYRTRFRPDVQPGVPEDVRLFAEETAAIWTPAPVFAMDVCRSGEGLYVVEINCFHSAGFYAAEVGRVLSDVSSLAVSTWTLFSDKR